MYNFGARKWEVVRGREEVFLLLINGKSEFETFIEEIENTSRSGIVIKVKYLDRT
jgi:hypothetical protein